MYVSLTLRSALCFHFLYLVNALSISASVGVNQWPTYEHSENKNQLCIECPPGFRLAGECQLGGGSPGQSKCIPCPAGEYLGWSNRPRCWEKEKCGPGERLHVDGKNVVQDVCECKPKFMRLSVGGPCHEAVGLTEYNRVVNLKKDCPECPTCQKCRICPTVTAPVPCTTVKPVSCPLCPTAEPCPQQVSCNSTGWIVAAFEFIFLIISGIFNMWCLCKHRDINVKKMQTVNGAAGAHTATPTPQSDSRTPATPPGEDPNPPGDATPTPQSDSRTPATPLGEDPNPPGDATPTPQSDSRTTATPLGEDPNPPGEGPTTEPTGDVTQPKSNLPEHRPPPQLDSPETTNEGKDDVAVSSGIGPIRDDEEGKEVDLFDEQGNLYVKATPFQSKEKTLPGVSITNEHKPKKTNKVKAETKPYVVYNKTSERNKPSSCSSKFTSEKNKQLDAAFRILEDKVPEAAMEIMRQVLKFPIEDAGKIDSEETKGDKKLQRAYFRWCQIEGDNANVYTLLRGLRERQYNSVADKIERELNVKGFERKEVRDQLDKDFAVCESELDKKTAKHFARDALKVDNKKIKEAEKDPDTFVMNVLRAWKQQNGDKATSELFRQLVKKSGISDLADKFAEDLNELQGTVQNSAQKIEYCDEEEPLIRQRNVKS